MITTFTRQNLPALRADIDAALKAVGEKHGIVVKTDGGGSFSPTNYTVKVGAAVKAENGEVVTKEAQDFKMLASSYGLPLEMLNKEFFVAGVSHKVTGIYPRKHKYPVAITIQGRRALTTAQGALSYWNRRAQPSPTGANA
jgi:hypothetical protein